MTGVPAELCETNYMIRDIKNKSRSDIAVWWLITGDCISSLHLSFTLLLLLVFIIIIITFIFLLVQFLSSNKLILESRMPLPNLYPSQCQSVFTEFPVPCQCTSTLPC